MMVTQWLTELDSLSEEEQGSWWEDRTLGFAYEWQEHVSRLEPLATEQRGAIRGVVKLEYKWFLLRENELTRIVEELEKFGFGELNRNQPDCIRSLVFNAAAQIRATYEHTWCNEWRYYSEGLARFNLRPHFPVPPDYAGKFPKGMEEFLGI